jgi:ABC-type transport system involved in multi-copper enzyme maturation permease subunit
VLWAELVKQLLRRRTAVALAALAALPLLAAVATAGDAGARNGRQAGLYGAAPYSALNHVAASLQFTAPLLLALVVALLGSAIGAGDREWGTLRYLYLQPVTPARLLRGKWTALLVCCVLATGCVSVTALVSGVVAFGWHPFHRLGAASVSASDASLDLLAASAYVAACTASIATLALALGLVLPGPAEALGASIALIVAANLVDGQPSLDTVSAALPVHYWGRWAHLLDGTRAGLATGLAVRAVWALAALAIARLAIARGDPVA